MISIALRALALAVLFCFAAAPQVQAQQQQDQTSGTSDGYKPPTRLITKEAAPRSPKSAPLTATAVTSQKTVGLVSVVGENFTVKTIGFTVFGNEEQKFPVAPWKIDDRVATSVARVLKKNFKVKRIQIPAGAFQTFRDGSFIFKSFEDELAKFIAQYTAGQKCDYYLLVSPGYSQISNTNQGIYGLGVVRWDHILNPGEYVHALSMLTVYDSQMKQLRSEFGSIGQDTFMVAVRGPNQELKADNKLPREPKAAIADARAQKIAWELLDKSLTMTLPKLLAAE